MPKKVTFLYSNDPYTEKQLFIFQLEKNLEMLKKNFDELQQQFGNFHNKEINNRVWHGAYSGELDNMIFELSRRMINFVSLAKALVDVNRNLIRKKFLGTEFLHKYQEVVDRFFTNNPIVEFIEGLRNYSLHYKIPIPNVKPVDSNSETDTPDNNTLIYDSIALLKKYKLLEWNDWGKKGKEYLNSLEENIDIESIINEYFKSLQEFYVWLFKFLNDEL
jgi:hypothetical protein